MKKKAINKEELSSEFSFIMPADIIKSEDGDWKVAGLASSEKLDLQGEKIIQKGMDLTPIDTKKGYFNYDHDNSPEGTIGMIDGYKMDQEGLYVHGRLFKEHDKAKAVYGIMRSLTKSDRGRVGMSVEGKVLERDPQNPKIITKCQIKNVALTLNPVNPTTYADLMKSMSHANVEFDTSKEENALETIKNEQQLEQKMFTSTEVMALIEKALSVGDAKATKVPAERSGGDALAQEELDMKPKDLQKNTKKKPKEMDKKLAKSLILDVLDQIQKLYPNHSRSAIWECVKDRLNTKFDVKINI